jgi:hypothetical protein
MLLQQPLFIPFVQLPLIAILAVLLLLKKMTEKMPIIDLLLQLPPHAMPLLCSALSLQSLALGVILLRLPLSSLQLLSNRVFPRPLPLHPRLLL